MQVKLYFATPYNDSSWKIVADNLEHALIRNPVVDLVRGDGKWAPDDISERIVLWWGQPSMWNVDNIQGKATIGMTLSEGDRLPANTYQEYVRNCNQCDLLLFASRAAAYPFRIAPIETPMFILPLGVDTNLFNFQERDFLTESFTFIHYGVTQVRKGSFLVLDAFSQIVELFPSSRLIFHHWTDWADPFQKLREKYNNVPNITWSRFDKGVGDAQDVVKLLKTAHCLLAPSLTEGWGMCITEAMATGMPVITSRYSAMLEYFSSKFGWWIEMGDQYLLLSELFPDTLGYMRVPSLVSLTEKMSKALIDREESSRRGLAGSRYIASSLTWDNTVTKLVPILIALNSGNITRFESMRTHPQEYFYTYNV